MLQALDVSFHKIVFLLAHFKVLIVLLNLDCFHINFVLLDVDYFLDCLLNVEYHMVFDEIFLLFVKDCIVKNIVNEEIDKLGGRKHLRTTLEHAIVNLPKLLDLFLLYHLVTFFLPKRMQNLSKTVKKGLH